MNQFDVLLLANAVVLALALVRLRPAGTLFAANQVIALRALSNIDSYGQPVDMAYLPGALFGRSGLDKAAVIFGISTAISLLIVVLPSARPPAEGNPKLPPLPRVLVWALALYFVAYVFSTKTIFFATYGVDGFYNFNLELAGMTALLEGLVLYELYRRVAVGELKRPYAVLFLAFFATLVHFIKGQTGFAAGFVVTGAFLLIGQPSKRLRSGLSLAGVLVLVAALVVVVRGVRGGFAEGGLETVDAVVRGASEAEADRERTGHGVEQRTNGTQNAAHVLMCIKLHDSGKDRGWRSITEAIVYTFEPSFLQGPLGFERPIDATWELATYFIHGGGIHLLADLYWNGGYVCVAVVMLLLAVWMALCDARHRASFHWLMLTCMFTPPSLMGVGYGFNHFARGIFNGLIVLLVWALARGLFAAARRTVARLEEMEPPEPVPVRVDAARREELDG